MKEKLRHIRHTIKQEIKVYRLVLAHERTPRAARFLIGAGVVYALSPIDLIPDWVPVLGHLDDVVAVPLLIWLGLRLVPPEVVVECRALAKTPSADSEQE